MDKKFEAQAAQAAKFLARANHVLELISLLEINVNENGVVVETNEVKLEQFFEQIEAYDLDVKDKERDEYEARQDAEQGFQALTDDE